MKKSTYLYGDNYDVEYIRKHLSPHYRKIEWAKELIEKLYKEPLETRDFRRINDCLDAIKFNQKIINEAWGVED